MAAPDALLKTVLRRREAHTAVPLLLLSCKGELILGRALGSVERVGGNLRDRAPGVATNEMSSITSAREVVRKCLQPRLVLLKPVINNV